MRNLILIPLLLVLSACQSGLSDGAVDSTFPPAGWETTSSEGRTQYLCNPPTCVSTELVLVDDLKIAGLSENLIRSGKVGTEAVSKVDAFISRARKGTYQAQEPIPVISENYAGFRHRATLEEDGRTLFLAGQSIIQGSGGILIVSIAHDTATAVKNLETYLSATKISRS